MSFSARFAFILLLASACSTQAAITPVDKVIPKNPSDWDNSTTCYIGISSSGILTVDGGSNLFSHECFLGYKQGGQGTVNISDANSIWDTSILHLGHEYYGEINIANGGKLMSNQSTMGSQVGTMGIVHVTGNGSIWENGTELTIGNFGTGQVDISEAGTINSTYCQIGNDSSSQGTVNISGVGSTWSNSGELWVGRNGKGTLNITDGGLVSVEGTLTIDAGNSGNSFVNIGTDGMLALYGNAESSLTAFLGLCQGTGEIRWRDDPLNDWQSLTTATLNTNCTLEYQTAGSLNGYTLLTIQEPQNTTLPGDANGDGIVDGSDVTILANNWQTLSGADQSMGDFNGDGVVDGSDVTILANNWQTGVKTTTTAAVPEPSSLLLLLFGLTTLGFIRHIR